MVHAGARDHLPLLVKFIDARQVLSVAVHPDDEKGRRLANDNGKTETWVILSAEPGSLIYARLKPGVGDATNSATAIESRGRSSTCSAGASPVPANAS